MLWTLLMAAVPIANADPAFERRFGSFLAGGYDPLSAPVSWYETEPVPGAGTAKAPITTHAGVSAAALERAAAWAESQGSTALIVARDGKLVFERYWAGADRKTLFNPQSMTKTLAALLVGIAVERGEVDSVDDPVGRYVREWRDDPRGRITLRQLLEMRSGLGQVDAGFGYKLVPEDPAVRHYFGSDFIGPVLALPQVEPPGTRFDYNNANTLLIALALERAAGKPYRSLISERLWRPLGLASAAIYTDRPGGFAMASCCLISRPIDWISIGQLILDRGSALVPAAWIDEMVRPSAGMPGYGLQLWLADQKVGGPPDPVQLLVPWLGEPLTDQGAVFLLGHGMQRVWILPAKRLVIVRAGNRWPSSWDESIIPNLIERGTE